MNRRNTRVSEKCRTTPTPTPTTATPTPTTPTTTPTTAIPSAFIKNNSASLSITQQGKDVTNTLEDNCNDTVCDDNQRISSMICQRKRRSSSSPPIPLPSSSLPPLPSFFNESPLIENSSSSSSSSSSPPLLLAVSTSPPPLSSFPTHPNTRAHNIVNVAVAKARRAAQSLWVLTHAQHCKLLPLGICRQKGCAEAKKVLLHIQICPAKDHNTLTCPYTYNGCEQTRKLLAHYKLCKEKRNNNNDRETTTTTMRRKKKKKRILATNDTREEIHNNNNDDDDRQGSEAEQNFQTTKAQPYTCLVCSLLSRHAKNALIGRTSMFFPAPSAPSNKTSGLEQLSKPQTISKAYSGRHQNATKKNMLNTTHNNGATCVSVPNLSSKIPALSSKSMPPAPPPPPRRNRAFSVASQLQYQQQQQQQKQRMNNASATTISAALDHEAANALSILRCSNDRQNHTVLGGRPRGRGDGAKTTTRNGVRRNRATSYDEAILLIQQQQRRQDSSSRTTKHGAACKIAEEMRGHTSDESKKNYKQQKGPRISITKETNNLTEENSFMIRRNRSTSLSLLASCATNDAAIMSTSKEIARKEATTAKGQIEEAKLLIKYSESLA